MELHLQQQRANQLSIFGVIDCFHFHIFWFGCLGYAQRFSELTQSSDDIDSTRCCCVVFSFVQHINFIRVHVCCRSREFHSPSFSRFSVQSGRSFRI